MAEYRPLRRKIYRLLAYPLQAAAAWLVFGVFRLMPIDAASAIGGFLGRTFGPLFPVTRHARRNLSLAMPELDARQRTAVVREMWDNLGRTVGEYPHLDGITRDIGEGGRVAVAGREHIAAMQVPGEASVLFSAHLANFEVFALALRKLGIEYAQVYRAPNNPYVDAMIRRIRRLSDDNIVPKGASGARKAIAVLRAGRRLGLLIDQKANDGMPVTFFGREAMAPAAVAQLALRFECPVFPVRIERLHGCRFVVTFFPPVDMPSSGDRHADGDEAMRRIYAYLETWIRERPGQWLWLHRRWPDS